jgi:hypothetical protein
LFEYCYVVSAQQRLKIADQLAPGLQLAPVLEPVTHESRLLAAELRVGERASLA